MKQKNDLAVWLIILSVVLITLPSAIIMMVGHHHYNFKDNAYIFEDISDFSFLKEYTVSEKVTDRHSSFLDISDSVTLSVKYRNAKYKLFAYTFASVEDALQYAGRISDNNYLAMYQADERSNFHYSESVNRIFFISNQCLVVSGNKVLVIRSYGNPKQHIDFISFVMTHLPLKVEFQT